MIGQTLGHYRILEKVGSGGMGVVYRARDEQLERDVALKVLPSGTLSNEASRRHFRKEALALAKFSHPNIETVYEFDTQEGMDFLVMEYVPGKTLAERLAGGALPEKEVVALGMQITAALEEAHERGIVHRDLKPRNIAITARGQAKVLDFGLAKLLPQVNEATSETVTDTQAGVGTLPYMSPEQLQGEPVDTRADIYTIGAVLYEMATGCRPFADGLTSLLIDAILHHPPVPPRALNSRISPELERVILKCLDKDPTRRYQSAKELLVDLRRLEAASSTHATAPSPPLSVWRRAARPAMYAGAALVALALGLAGLNVRGWRDRLIGRTRSPQIRSVAVLPLENQSRDPESAAFSDGLTETLTAKLTQLTVSRALQVISASEVRARQVRTVDQARKEFGVNLALEGNLNRSGKLVRINYGLVDTHTHRQLSAESITLAVSDPFAVQDQVVNGAVRMLELEVQPPQLQALDTYGTQVPGAYDFYLQGRGYLQNYDKVENLESAITVFQRALALDPSYALAYTGLGQAYWEKYLAGKETRLVDSARAACERALSLDAKLAAAHGCLGRLEGGTGEYEKAIEEFERAVEIEPTSDDAYRGLAEAYARLGRLDAAEKTYRRAIQLRPEYWAGYNWLGAFYYHQARYQEAAEAFNHVVALAPDSFRGYSNLGAAYVGQDRYREAIGVLERSIAIRPTDYGYTNLGNAYFYLRQYEQAARAYEQAVKLTEKDPLLWWNLGDGYYWTPGKRAQAASAYRQAIALAEEELRVNPRDAYALGILAICHAMLSEKEPALETLRRGLQLSPNDPFLCFQAALVHNQFGESNQAIAWLNKALAAGYSSSRIRDTPNFDALRADPRFQELVRPK